MSKKTLALIVSLVLLTVALLAVALSTKQPTTTPDGVGEPTVTPTPPAHTVLNLTPATLTAVAGTNQVQVQIDTDDNQVTAVQLEIAYDPKVLSNVRVTQGTFFQNPVVLLNANDTTTGRISYAIGIAPAQEAMNGTGTVATISFAPNPTATVTETQLELLPKSLVTARGITASVLKTSTGTRVTLPTRGGVTTPNQTQTAPPVTTSPQVAQ
jgi:hypothetical protein